MRERPKHPMPENKSKWCDVSLEAKKLSNAFWEGEDGQEEEIREWVKQKKNLHTGKEEHKQNETI